MELSVLGIDLAKNVFQLHGLNSEGRAVLKKKVSRKKLTEFVANLKPCVVGIEACGGSHHWGRTFREMGHEVRMVAPKYVKPYVKTNKNDSADAEAICEAVTRPNMRFVAIKEVAQQEIQFIHRFRSRVVGERTALANEIRGILSEIGIVIPRGVTYVTKNRQIVLDEASSKLNGITYGELESAFSEFERLSKRVKEYDRTIQKIYEENDTCKKIGEVPGVGPLTATALVAAVPKGQFKNPRSLSAWLGIVPRQKSSGGREKLLGISKRGDTYLRTLLIHGARTVMRGIEKKEDSYQKRWLTQLQERRGYNRATVALANKNARVILRIINGTTTYNPRHMDEKLV